MKWKDNSDACLHLNEGWEWCTVFWDVLGKKEQAISTHSKQSVQSSLSFAEVNYTKCQIVISSNYTC